MTASSTLERCTENVFIETTKRTSAPFNAAIVSAIETRIADLWIIWDRGENDTTKGKPNEC